MPIELEAAPATLLPLTAFCIGIYFLVLCTRFVIEVKFPKVCDHKSWKKILRVLPPMYGGVAAAVMHQYPFLDTLPTWGTRFIYGCFGGGIASFAYLIFKAVIQKWFGVHVSGDTDAPPAKKCE